MKENLSEAFALKSSKETDQKINAEKRKQYFQEIGRKGGLRTKSKMQLTKVLSFRLTELEYEESVKESQKYNLKLAAYSRMRYLETSLKINEFENDEILLGYGNNFIRINNLLRNREWNIFENKKQVLEEIQDILKLIREYLYSKMKQNRSDE